jgi:hypothetical protein
MPSDATTILRIDPIKNVATTFGKVSNTINKWQGGVLSAVDNCVYAVPADMDCVLRIDTDPNTPLDIDLVGEGFQEIDDKWQGGFLANDGKIYAIPVSFIKPFCLQMYQCVHPIPVLLLKSNHFHCVCMNRKILIMSW